MTITLHDGKIERDDLYAMAMPQGINQKSIFENDDKCLETEKDKSKKLSDSKIRHLIYEKYGLELNALQSQPMPRKMTNLHI